MKTPEPDGIVTRNLRSTRGVVTLLFEVYGDLEILSVIAYESRLRNRLKLLNGDLEVLYDGEIVPLWEALHHALLAHHAALLKRLGIDGSYSLN